MSIKLFVSRCSGNMEIKKRQEYMISVLQARKIEFEEIDISDPTREADKQFMREHSPPKEGQSVVLPPVIFKSEVYCADYDTFLDAVECNTLFELLGIEKA